MNPTPEQIKKLRYLSELTQSQSADLCHVTIKGWQHWEYGIRKMPPAIWELFRIKVGVSDDYGDIKEFIKNWC